MSHSKEKKGTPKPFKVTKSFFIAVSLEKGGGASQSLLCMLLLPYQSHSLANSCLFSFSLSLPFFPHFADSQKGPRYLRCCCFLPFDLHGFLSLTILSFSVSIYNPSVLTISTPAEPGSVKAVPATEMLLHLGTWRANDWRCSKQFLFVCFLFLLFLCYFFFSSLSQAKDLRVERVCLLGFLRKKKQRQSKHSGVLATADFCAGTS